MPLSFSSILFSNSVAKCSNLKPDFFSLNSGLISLKLLLSPKINLSCSSLLEAKGKGGDSVRWREGYVGVSIINVQDETKYDKEETGEVVGVSTSVNLRAIFVNVCTLRLLTLNWVQLITVCPSSDEKAESAIPGGETRPGVSRLLGPSQDMWRVTGKLGDKLVRIIIIYTRAIFLRDKNYQFIFSPKIYSSDKNISSCIKIFVDHPACRTAPAPAPPSPIFWHLLPQGQGGGRRVNYLILRQCHQWWAMDNHFLTWW